MIRPMLADEDPCALDAIQQALVPDSPPGSGAQRPWDRDEESVRRGLRASRVAQFPVRYRAGLICGVFYVGTSALVFSGYPWPVPLRLSPSEVLALHGGWLVAVALFFLCSYLVAGKERWQVVLAVTSVAINAAIMGVCCAYTGRMASPFYPSIILLSIVACTFGVTFGVPAVSLIVGMLLLVWGALTCLWPAGPSVPLRGTHVWLHLLFILGACGAGLYAAALTERLAMRLEAALLSGRYRLVKRIGGGGMGEVYLAYHASLRRPCAVKVLKAGIDSRQARARFEREAAAASSLRHPNTIAVFDYGTTHDGHPYYVMELLEGEDVGAMVQHHGPLPPARAVRLLLQAARSLAEAHALGMVHRDIKPANLFVTEVAGERDFVKVLDFGLVKMQAAWSALESSLTQADAVLGTPRYMAPEALRGEVVDARADVYGLGATGYYALTGAEPFGLGPGGGRQAPAAVVLRQRLENDPPRISEVRNASLPPISRELDEVLRRCVALDPAHRYQDADSVLRALQETPEALDGA